MHGHGVRKGASEQWHVAHACMGQDVSMGCGVREGAGGGQLHVWDLGGSARGCRTWVTHGAHQEKGAKVGMVARAPIGCPGWASFSGGQQRAMSVV